MEGTGTGNRRIVDLIVEEVSVVDRAANKRRFLIVKRDGGSTVEHDELIKALIELPEYAAGLEEGQRASLADALQKALEGVSPKTEAEATEKTESEAEAAEKAEPEADAKTGPETKAELEAEAKADPVEKADPAADQLTRIEAMMQSLSTSNDELSGKLDGIDSRLGTVEKSTGIPNAALIESTDSVEAGDGNAVQWDMDMNAPVVTD